jgi:hypothetical protein
MLLVTIVLGLLCITHSNISVAEKEFQKTHSIKTSFATLQESYCRVILAALLLSIAIALAWKMFAILVVLFTFGEYLECCVPNRYLKNQSDSN